MRGQVQWRGMQWQQWASQHGASFLPEPQYSLDSISHLLLDMPPTAAAEKLPWAFFPLAEPIPLQAKPYVGPVQLETTEAVLARCGDAERLLVRVAAKLPTAMQAAEANPSSTGNSSDAHVPASDKVDALQAGALPTGTDITASLSPGSTVSFSPGTHPSSRGSPASPMAGSSPASPSAEDQPLNVLVIFIDSLQRRRFFRRLPKTVAALEGLPATSGGATTLYQFFRHHIVGINTGGALAAGPLHADCVGPSGQSLWP